MKSVAIAMGLLLLLSVSSQTLSAQVRSSGSYQLQSDSLNFGGGLSSSTNYVQESTIGEVATGESSSSNYTLKAGYQQMQSVYLALSAAADVTMSSLAGVGGGTANGSTTVTVTTDGPAGYQLTIEAENSPALQSSSETISDYTPAAAEPDFTFMTAAADAHFGYSPTGVDVVDRFLDNGVDTCDTGSTNTNLACWDGLSTTAETVASATGANQPNGATTTINFRVGLGSSVVQEDGVYVATTTLTAIAL